MTTDSQSDASASADAGANDSSDGAPDFDFAAFQSELTSVRESAVTKAELESVKRSVGHIPALQSSLDKLNEKLEAPPADPRYDRLAEQLDALAGALGDVLSPEARAAVEQPRVAGAVDERFDRLEQLVEKATAPAEESDSVPEPEIDPLQAAANAEWQMATEAVLKYAADKGVKLEEDADSWQKEFLAVQAAHPTDPISAARSLMERIDSQSPEAADERRAERAEAASGGPESAQSAGSKGSFDLTTVSGIVEARQAGALDSNEFIELWRQAT